MKNLVNDYKENLINEFLNSLDTEVDLAYLSYADIESWDDLESEVMNNNLCNVEVIYYSVAMDYLRENDPSLMESMGLAAELGYEASNINSELLASLLQSLKVREEFMRLQDEVETFYEDLEITMDEIEDYIDEEEPTKEKLTAYLETL